MKTIEKQEKQSKDIIIFDDINFINGRGAFHLKVETYTEDNIKNRYILTIHNNTSIAELVYNNDKDSEKCYSLLLENPLDSYCGFHFNNIMLSSKTHNKIDKLCKAIGETDNYSVKDVRLYGKGFANKSRFFNLPLI